MAATAMVHARVEEAVKQQATIALEKMGLTVSGAVNMFLTRVAVDQAIPFEVRVPNEETRAAMAESHAIIVNGNARFHDFNSLVAALEASDE